MPRSTSVAPPAEQSLTGYNVLQDFKKGKARVYRGIHALRVFADDPSHIPFVSDYPFYEHKEAYGDDTYSILVYPQLEDPLKRKLDEKLIVPTKGKGGGDKLVPRDFKWEHVYIDLYLTPHEKAAHDIGDVTNLCNMFIALDKYWWDLNDDGRRENYRGGIHDTVVGLSLEPVAVDFESIHVDIWPSGPNKGKYLSDMDEEFLNNTVKRGSGRTNKHLQELKYIAEAELSRRSNEAKAKAEKGVKK